MRASVGLLVLFHVILCFADEKIQNKDFIGNMDSWYTYLAASSDEVSLKKVSDEYDVLFTLADGGDDAWSVLLCQPISIRAGYRYSIGFGGIGIDGTKQLEVGLCHNGSKGEGGDGSDDFTWYAGMDATLPKWEYAEFRTQWENDNVDDEIVRFYIHGGGNATDFKIAWVSVWESPLDPSSTDAGRELITNKDFTTGNLDGWYTYLEKTSDKVSMEQVEGDYDVLFTLEDGGDSAWEVLLCQPISVSAGHKYSITFGGVGTEAAKKVEIGLCHNGGKGLGGDGSDNYAWYAGMDATLPKWDYAEFKTVWDNTDITDDNVRVYIHGGGDATDFQISWVSVWESILENPAPECRLSQSGFYPDGSKLAVIEGLDSTGFELRDNAGTVCYQGTCSSVSKWSPSGESVRIADFSSFSETGTYALFVNDQKISDDFSVSPHALAALGAASIKANYYQRASAALSSEYAETWARAIGHPDTEVRVHSSAGSGTISVPKGWYDAGDYGKYIVNSGVTVYTLLALYNHFPDYFESLSMNIPESGDAVPDILDEVKWNLEWMLAMQAEDGGVYSKCTSLKFNGTIMPGESESLRYVFMKTTAASLDFAAVMAMSSKTYFTFDADFAAKCGNAAKEAFAWAVSHPDVAYVQPADCSTGEYGDSEFSDEFFWASVELCAATGNAAAYEQYADSLFPEALMPNWKDVGTLGLYTIVNSPDFFAETLVTKAAESIRQLAEVLIARQKDGYHVAMSSDDFHWGSNGVAASGGIHLLYMYHLTKDVTYRVAAEHQIDYLLGRNPLSTSYVTGFGGRSPLHPHHRISEADGIAKPIPGFLVGGPNTDGEDTAYCIDYLAEPASSWVDRYCSYASNEIAINWNAALAYLSNALEAIHNGHKAKGFVRTTTRSRVSPNGSFGTRDIAVTYSGTNFRIVFTMDNDASSQSIPLRIFNMQGREVYSQDIKCITTVNSTKSVPVGKFGSGCFIVRIGSGANVAHQRFIVP